MTVPTVTINVADNASSAAIQLPQTSVHVKIGCSTGGTVNVPYATTNPAALVTNFGQGPLVQAGGMICQAGGVCIAISVPIVTKGAVLGGNSLAVTGATNASPVVITTAAHGLVTGDVVTIATVGGNTAANGTWDIIVLSSTTFSLTGSTGNSAYTSGGTAVWGGVYVTGTGTSVPTVTVDGTSGSFDHFAVEMKVVAGGTIGTAGIQYQISLDAGRNFGAILSLGTAVSYLIPDTGVTLNFAAGTLVTGDIFRFSTSAPLWNTAGLQAALAALAASQYALAGWGSMQIVGAASASDVTTVETYLDSMAAQFVFTRVIMSCRDASPPTMWGGTGETEAAWMASITTAFSAVSTKRVVVGGGNYNMPSPYPNAAAGVPSYRRNLAWADSVRRILVPAQRRGGRVKDGSLSNIVVDPATMQSDGFIYHDERTTPGLDVARFMAAMTWKKKQGFFICHENLMSPSGSQFTELPLGNIIDVACDIAYATGSEEISDDLLLQKNGTLVPTDALALEALINGALAVGMTDIGMCSNAFCSVSRTANVGATSTIPIALSVLPKGYVNAITFTINLATT